MSTAEQPPEADISLWQRRLAAEANNRAWTLAETAARTEAEDAEMLHAAHASRYLWGKIGTGRNLALAHTLLGQVHALLGHAQLATEYAGKAFAYFTTRQSEPGQLAFAYAVQSHAAAVSGHHAGHRANYARALEIADTMTDSESRRIFDATIAVIPKPAPA